jgi:hypothetical protein
MALQRGHVAFILRWAIIATEGAYNVGVISNVFPLFFDMFLVYMDSFFFSPLFHVSS